MPPREEVITVGETKVQVVIGGQGDPLVVLHGAGGNRGWRRWMAAVGERYTIYAPTHPGFGRSDAADWMEPYRRFWDESFGRLDDHLTRMKKEKEKPR